VILRCTEGLTAEEQLEIFATQLNMQRTKIAADTETVYNLGGKLFYAEDTDYLMLSVPNALVHGVFAAMVEPGVELPLFSTGKPLSAHITVMTPTDLAAIGGAGKVKERGQQFRYSLGRLKQVRPDGWPGVVRCFFVTVHSPELQALRRSYGLSALPRDGQGEFHITTGIIRRGVLGNNTTAKKS